MYKIQPTKQAKKDADMCVRAGYAKQLTDILKTVEQDPYEPTQHFERLTGNMSGVCSRKINHYNRFVYTVLPNDTGARDEDGKLYDGIVLVHESWGHRYKKPRKHPKKR